MNRLAFCLALLLTWSAIGQSAPLSESTNVDFGTYNQLKVQHRNLYRFIDQLTWSNAFKWGDAATGTINMTVVSTMVAQMVGYLTEEATMTLRQCDRMSDQCYYCGTGPIQIGAALVNFAIAGKLYGQHHIIGDTDIVYQSPDRYILYNTYYMGGYAGVTNATCPPVCIPGATAPICPQPNCLPATLADCRKIDYYADRIHEYVKVNGKYKLDRVKTGLRFSYTAASEPGGRATAPAVGAVFGDTLPGEDVMNSKRDGPFCVA